MHKPRINYHSNKSLLLQAIEAQAEGNDQLAEEIYTTLISRGEYTPEIFCSLGIIYDKQALQKKRELLLEKALRLYPDNPLVLLNLGATLQKAGQTEAAISHYERCLQVRPSSPEVLNNLGVLYCDIGNYNKSLDYLKMALSIKPGHEDASVNLARTYCAVGDHLAAKEIIEDGSLALCNNPLALQLLGDIFFNEKDCIQAVIYYKAALETNPFKSELLVRVGRALEMAGQADAALEYLLQASAIDPDNARLLAHIGVCLRSLRLLDQAIDVTRKAHALDRADADISNLLGVFCADKGDLDLAVQILSEALDDSPSHCDLSDNLASVYRNLGELDLSISIFDDTLCNGMLREGAVYGQMFNYSIGGEGYALKAQSLAERHWGQRPMSSSTSLSVYDPDFFHIKSQAKLRIGFLCTEIGDHVVGRFLASYLRFYDRNSVEVELISPTRRFDAQEEALASLASACITIRGQSTQEARRTIQKRHYDIIVETSGYTRDSSIHLLAERCAPVQCHYIGYHATTGLNTIDYFIGDRETVPESFGWQFCEKLWQLPRTWLAYTPLEPIPNAKSMIMASNPVFGSFNQLTKARRETITFWAEALRQVSGSQLILKGQAMNNNSAQSRIRKELDALLIDESRVHFLPHSATWSEHMDTYNMIDVALDTTPWSSATTGVEALSMGVPLISIRGNCTAARMSSSIVKSIDRLEWIAETPEQFGTIAGNICSDLTRLRDKKCSLQSWVLASPLYDAKDLASSLTAAFKDMSSNFNSRNQSQDNLFPCLLDDSSFPTQYA